MLGQQFSCVSAVCIWFSTEVLVSIFGGGLVIVTWKLLLRVANSCFVISSVFGFRPKISDFVKWIGFGYFWMCVFPPILHVVLAASGCFSMIFNEDICFFGVGWSWAVIKLWILQKCYMISQFYGFWWLNLSQKFGFGSRFILGTCGESYLAEETFQVFVWKE